MPQDNRRNFIDTYGSIYEHSPWVAETVFDQGHGDSSPLDLIGPMRAAVESAGPDLQMILLRAHPDLAGKLSKSGALTAESTSEQASAGLDQCTEAEFQAFTALNSRYKETFGFPYILAVRGRNRQEILQNFRARVDNDTAQEFREALDQVHQIARLRLESLQ